MRSELTFNFFRFLAVVVLLGVSLLFFSYLVSAAKVSGLAGDSSQNSARYQNKSWYERENTVALSMSMIVDDFHQSTKSIQQSVGSGFRTIGSVTYVGIRFVGSSVQTGISTLGRGVANGFAMVGRSTSTLVRSVSSTKVVSALIKPSEKSELPVIDSYAMTTPATKNMVSELPKKQQTSQEKSAKVVWPMHGNITTRFGVPHWPYQPTHTGIDISNGKGSGVTAIRPFKVGKVIKPIYSQSGLGNHVIVDHGGGMNSVYAHLSSIRVKVGQSVDHTSTIGYAGSTGASTGPHLHFEIRIDGTPVNPLPYLPKS